MRSTRVVALICILFLAACGRPSRVTISAGPALVGHLRVVESPTTTTTTAPPPTTVVPRPAVVHAARSAPVVPSSSDVWAALAMCESHMTNANTGNGFYGFFQFMLGTWHSLGYSGSPTDYPYEVQREAAQRLVARSGWGQFPVCGRRVS